MAEEIVVDKSASKKQQYAEILPQLQALIQSESSLIANLSNTTAVLKYAFNFFWVGFYLVDENQNNLVLGPFQGPVACTRIEKGKGVCGKAWQNAQSICVADVEKFPGHIACSSLSKSELVIPIFSTNQNRIIGVLDVDSDELDFFNEDDISGLEKVVDLIIQKHFS